MLSNVLPSQYKKESWLYVFNSSKFKFVSSRWTGKWLIFVPVGQVDKAWQVIKENTESNQLGTCAKVATALDSKYDKRVICVYNNNYKNVQEVNSIRQKLAELGFDWPICYKTDMSTLFNKQGGHKSHLYCNK